MLSGKIQHASHLPGFLVMPLPDDRSASNPVPRFPAPAASSGLTALTRAVRRRDPAAFSEFYDRYSFRIYKHLLFLTRGDEQLAGEVLQTVAIKLAVKMEIFTAEPPLLAWLQRLARNAFIDHCRARRRENLSVPLDEAALAGLADRTAETALQNALDQALADCPPEDRELLHAAYVDGQPLAHLAAHHGQTYKALESRLARLRQKIRLRLLRALRHE
ncbi:MAG: sigma-70 family RNA polymerase sigma factor [Opitutales bacterium]|jgi:RNA polymerase sigma factor (sigma-70 family)